MRAPERLGAALLPLLLAGSVGAAEPTPQQQLESVQKSIAEDRARHDKAAQESAALAAELADLQAQSVTVAAAVQAREAALGAIEARLAALAEDERKGQATLARDGVREGIVLRTLVHIAAAPREAWALGPMPPVDAARSALLMARAVPALDAEAASLKDELARLERTRAAEEAARIEGANAQQALSAEKTRIADLIAAKAALEGDAQRTAEETQTRLVALAAEAGSLRDLVDRIEADRRRQQAKPAVPGGLALAVPHPPGGAGPFAAARGKLVFPATGTVVARFGTVDENGTPRRGLTLETRPGAQVVAPYDGAIEFAGPFRGYGQILIIAHGDGYHSLLAGLDRIDGSPGQRLVAGEPVGSMSTHADKPQLYLELRHNNQPIDPLPWLTTRLEKVNG